MVEQRLHVTSDLDSRELFQEPSSRPADVTHVLLCGRCGIVLHREKGGEDVPVIHICYNCGAVNEYRR